MKRNHTIRLYNVLFPVWFLMYLYPSWLPLAVLAFNFAFDSLVLALAARWQKLPEIRQLWKQTILRVWLLGFAADILGALLNFAVYLGVAALGELGDAWEQALYGFFPVDSRSQNGHIRRNAFNYDFQAFQKQNLIVHKKK